METYKITESIEHQYKGSGWALAAVFDGQVVHLRYLSDIASEALANVLADTAHAEFFLKQWMTTNEAARHIRELQSLGQVAIGMCSSWEFVVM